MLSKPSTPAFFGAAGQALWSLLCEGLVTSVYSVQGSNRGNTITMVMATWELY